MSWRRARLVLAFLALAGRLAADPAAGLSPDTVLKPRAATAGEPDRPAGGFDGAVTGIAVVLLGVAGGWVLWRRLRMSAPPARGERLLSIAETRSLGNRQYLVVASYGEQRFLLGVCPGRIGLLSRLDPGAREPESRDP